jgi:SagB-type dehydrogenase family enzyme
MSDRHFLSLSPRCRVVAGEEGLAVACGVRRLQLDPAMRRFGPALERLRHGVGPGELHALEDDPAAIPWLYFLVARLRAAGMLCHAVRRDGQPWMTMGSLSASAVEPVQLSAERDMVETARWRLVRFAYLRCNDGVWQLLCPATSAYVELAAPSALALLHALGTFHTVPELAAQSGLPATMVGDAMALLAGGGMVQRESDSASEPAAYRLWEFHDLLFHWGSRLGRADKPYGGTFDHPEDMAPLPAVKPPGAGPVVPLPRHAAGPALRSDSLDAVMTRRRSIRAHGADAIGLPQLGEFLHRCARHVKTIDTDHGELAVRPYPAGGALHELELYLVVDRCDGIAPGLYHYRTREHALQRMEGTGPDTEALLEAASATLAGAGRPQVLIVVAARFQRLSWKYRSVVYALVLKHVGVLYQTFYLVATDMGLAPCAMGGGDSELFARASGIDPMLESSVGEFALGTPGEGRGDDEY